MAFGNFENQSSQLEDEETGLTKKPQRKEEAELENADNQQSTADTPEGYTGGKRERQDRVDPQQQNLLSDSVFENYYADKSLDDMKETIDYLNQVRQQANEVKLLRFVTGRGEQKPEGDTAGVIQKRPDLEDLFAVGSMSDPDDQSRYMTDVSAAHDLIEYLASETKKAIHRKENETNKKEENNPKKPERGDLPTDTAENPGEVPESVKEGKSGTGSEELSEQEQEKGSGEADSEEGNEETEYGPGPDRSDLPTDTAENPGEVPEGVKEGKRGSGSEGGPEEGSEEAEYGPGPERGDLPTDTADNPGEVPEAVKEGKGGQDQEEGPEQEEGEEMPDIPDPEDLQEEPQELKEARVKFLKAQRIHTSILRGETVQKLMTWIPGVDRRSVTHEGEELFFDGNNDERNLRVLKNNYAEKLEADKDEKIRNFVANELENVSEGQKEQVITEFAQNLQAAQQQNQNEAFQALDESFDDSSFRDFWRRDDVWWSRMGLSGAGLTASLAGSAATSGAGYATWRTAVGTASGYTMAEGYLEQTDNGLLDWISRRGAVSDIASGLDDGASSEDIRGAIEDRFSVEYANEDNQNAELKRELNRMRMLANELGTSVDEAVAGGNEMTAQIVQEMQDMERDLVADTAIESIRGDAEDFGNLEDEAIHQGMMDSFSANENFMMSRMVEEGSQERVRKMQRKIGGAIAGAGMGWLIGSGRMGKMLREGAEEIGDAWEGGKDWLWPGGAETPPAEPGPGMSELPPEMQLEPDAETIFDVEITDWDGQEVYGDETKARSFIEATGDIKDQMQDLDAFDVTGGQGSPLDNLQAAENLQEFLDGDIANDLAERLDGYRPEDIKESLVVDPGETLSVTKEGDLVLEQSSGETELLYNGAQDQVNTDVLKDDLFGDFDDVSGGQTVDQSPDLAGDGTQEASKVEGAGVENLEGDSQISTDTSVDAGGGLESQLSETVVANNPDQANGVMEGAIHSYTESLDNASYDPEYMSNLSLPEGMSQDAFTDHIRSLEQQDQLLNQLPHIAENEPEKLRAFRTLFDSYAEANMTPPGVDISDTQELETLYESVNNYLDSESLDVAGSGLDAGDAAPEPPSPESAGAETGGSTNAGVEGTDNQVGTYDGPQGMTDINEAGEAGQEAAQQTSEQPASTATEQPTDTAQTEAGPSPADTGSEAGPEDGSGSGVESGENAPSGARESVSPYDRVTDAGVYNADITAEEANMVEPLADTGTSPEDYLGRNLFPEAATRSFDNHPSLQSVSPEEWRNLTDTFKNASSFSDGVNQLIENGQTSQLETVFQTLEAEQTGDLGTGFQTSGQDTEVMQAFVNDQYEAAIGDNIPGLDVANEAGQEAAAQPETVNPGYDTEGIPELTTEVSGDEQLFELAQQEFAPGEVFTHNGKTYVFTEGLSTDQAFTKAQGALSAAVGEDTISSSVEYQLPAEYRDGSDQAAALVQLGLN